MENDAMYFGSVKFFKQVIYSFVICAAALMAAFALFFGIICSADSSNAIPVSLPPVETGVPGDTISASALNVPDGTTIDQVYLALAAKGYDDYDIIEFLSSENSSALENYINRAVIEYTDSEKIESDAPATVGSKTASAKDSVCLIFDGTPSANTGDILSILDKYNISSLFLVDSGNIPECGSYEDSLLKRIHSEGHAIGILYDGKEDAALYDTERYVYSITAERPRRFDSTRLIYSTYIASNVPSWSAAYTSAVAAAESSDGFAVLGFCGSDGGEVGISALEDVIVRLEKEGFSFTGNSSSGQ